MEFHLQPQSLEQQRGQKPIPRESKGRERIFPQHQISPDLQVVNHRACPHHEDQDIQQKFNSRLLPNLET